MINCTVDFGYTTNQGDIEQIFEIRAFVVAVNSRGFNVELKTGADFFISHTDVQSAVCVDENDHCEFVNFIIEAKYASKIDEIVSHLVSRHKGVAVEFNKSSTEFAEDIAYRIKDFLVAAEEQKV